MRIIGHLPTELSASTFSDFLYVQGITNVVESEKEGWAVWIHSEDELEKARELLARYVRNPNDSSYQKTSRKAVELKEREQEEASASESRIFDRSKLFRATTAYGVGPLTMILIFVCVALAIYSRLDASSEVLRGFHITQFEIKGRMIEWAPGLPEILHGQVWRLLTPILVHDGPMHLFFNMFGLLVLGSMIEGRQGIGRLALLTLVIAAASNLAQYYKYGPNFCGMSGVLYGLLGYIWMKGKFDPASGLFLNQQTIYMMLAWFFLCLFGVIPNIANMVHAVGLVIGVAWGFLSSYPAMKGRR